MKKVTLLSSYLFFTSLIICSQNYHPIPQNSFEDITGQSLYQLIQNHQLKNSKIVNEKLDIVANKIEKKGNHKLKSDFLFLKAFIAMKKETQIFQNAKKEYKNFAELHLIDYPYKAKLNVLDAYLSFYKGEWITSLNKFETCLQLAKQEKDIIIEIICKLHKSYITSYTLDKVKGLKELKKLYHNLDTTPFPNKIKKDILIYKSKVAERIFRNYIICKPSEIDSIKLYNDSYTKSIKKLGDTLAYPRMFLANAYTFTRLQKSTIANQYLDSAKYDQRNYFNYYLLAEVYYHQKKYTKTISTIKKSKFINLEKEDYPWLRNEFQLLAKSYQKVGDFKKSSHYYNNYDKAIKNLHSILDSVSTSIQQKELKNYENQIQELNTQKTDNDYKLKRLLIVTASIFNILLLVFVYLYYLKKKKEKGNIKSLKKAVKDTSKPKKLELNIKKETVNQILKKLKKLEHENYFLNTECNVYNTAKKIKTNTSYLSKVVNLHYKKSFNDYINELRICYIIQKLNTNRIYKSYSIQSLSRETGYKSPDSFRKAFKLYTGELPSIYLKNLNIMESPKASKLK